jgi:hypothetical protein
MTVLRLSGFAGENRALHPMLLPEAVGLVSTNQKPGRGDLRPWNAPLAVATVPAGRKTIYRMGLDVASDVNYWLSWTTPVHAVRGPNASDAAERTYYTGSGTPKWTNTTLALSSAPFPTAYRELGMPPPTTVPVLTSALPAAVAASALVIDSVYTVTDVGNTDWIALGAANELVTAGNLVVGTVYTIKSLGSTNFALFGAASSVVGVVFTATANANGTGTASKNDLTGVVFTAQAVGTGTGTARATSEVTETRVYAYTTVSELGEESAPSGPSLPITCKQNAIVTLTNLSTPSGAYGINRYRIYRTQTGSTSTEFFFLREIASNLVTTTDDNRTLGEVLPTTTWLMPPADLSHLTGLWNGMMAGITGRAVRFCEAFVPYAWPAAYEVLASNTTPVALGTFGQTLVVLTNGAPILVGGGSPDAMDEQPTAFLQACVAPASVVSLGHGVAWASPDGLAYIGQDGARMLTEGVMTREDWQALAPSSILGCMFERRYFGFYTVGGTRKGFVVDPANSSGVYFLDFGVDAVYVDDLQDALYVLDGVSVKKWDASSALTVTFKSKLHRLPKPACAFAVAEVTADAYPVSFKLYADGVLRHTQTVASAAPFRLPGGYHAQTAQMEVSGTSAVQGVAVAHSMAELAQT